MKGYAVSRIKLWHMFTFSKSSKKFSTRNNAFKFVRKFRMLNIFNFGAYLVKATACFSLNSPSENFSSVTLQFPIARIMESLAITEGMVMDSRPLHKLSTVSTSRIKKSPVCGRTTRFRFGVLSATVMNWL
ncbi:hypothetical protein V8G54_019038 [Vigna mungo]|uniref:Uncharacterized protein n=1 Tax=Vigna mungo TaxID=3915 RepID=A0AAQ3NAP8_VIGMU